MWVYDITRPGFAEECRRQSLVIANDPHEREVVEWLDQVLGEAPWYAAAYRWRASARAASGQRMGAMRDVLCYRLAAPDSAGRALAGRALAALAAADTLAALTMLKN